MVAVILPSATVSVQGDWMLALPLPPSSVTAIVYVPSASVSAGAAASSSFKTGFVTETLWSYHLPFVPMMATSNSSSSAGTGISKPLTSSLRPSE